MMRLGLGCVSLGARAHVADDIRLVHEAIELGVNVFDTADVYNGGASEQVLGRAIRGRRDDVLVATKGGFAFRSRRPVEQWARRRARTFLGAVRPGQPALGVGGGSVSRSYDHQDFSPRHLRDAVHASLRRLRTDRIDVYQLHSPENLIPDVLHQLTDLVTAGDIVRFGVGAGSVGSANDWVSVPGIGVVQVPFGVLDPEAADTTFPTARRQGCELWVRGVLGGGVLGLAERDPTSVADHPKRSQITGLRKIAADAGLDQFQLAFGFLGAYSADVSTAVVGSSSSFHMRRNVELVTSGPLSGDVVQAIVELSSRPSEDS